MTETKDDAAILAEYARSADPATFCGWDAPAMAREIGRLRAQLAGVREKVEKLPAYSPRGGCDYFDRDDVLAALDGAT